jgi:hypothetical protein
MRSTSAPGHRRRLQSQPSWHRGPAAGAVLPLDQTLRLHPAQPLGFGRRSRRRRLGELHHAHPGAARNSSTMPRAASAAALLRTLCGAPSGATSARPGAGLGRKMGSARIKPSLTLFTTRRSPRVEVRRFARTTWCSKGERMVGRWPSGSP